LDALPKVLVVNNYPTRERILRVEACVKGNGADVSPVEWDEVTTPRFNSFDGVVLSGSPAMMTEKKTQAKFEKEAEAIRDSRVPVLGICFGHQLMAHAFGAKVVKDKGPVLDMVKTEVLASDPLFLGLPKSMMLLESRYEVVSSLPRGFSILARSATSRIAAMKHGSRPLYGVQFHPERFTREHPEGNRVVGNFVGLLK
jgi:GMP synthase (glutamine-hydrolysing)